MTRPTTRWARIGAVTCVITLFVVAIADAHDTFLKPVRYFVSPGEQLLVRVLNGTFTTSENSIARARLRDLSALGPQGRTKIDTSVWTVAGDTSTFTFSGAEPGTYVLGASTKPNFIALTGKQFTDYLTEDGIPDVLEARRKGGEMDKPARERYSKHVKALVQVGDGRSNSALTALGYAAELLPLVDPYALKAGDTLDARTMVDGKATAGLLVLFGGHSASGVAIAERSARSNASGVVRVPLRSAGVWYVKFISMVRVTGDTVDYESKWATLTFEVR